MLALREKKRYLDMALRCQEDKMCQPQSGSALAAVLGEN